LYINPQGNIGIGTTNPTSKLVVTGSVAVQGSMVAKSLVGSLTGSVKLPTIAQGTSETNIVLVDGSGGLVYRSNLSLTGAQGSQGATGVQGTNGTVGTQGFQGTQGIQGTQGTQGIQGTVGTQGFQGNQGAQGNQGIQGFQGTQGIQGTQGTQGTQGIQGTVGTQGFQGNQGAQGNQGIQGTVGTQGIQGTVGTQGFQGRQGPQGNQGPTGIQGTVGTQGATGASAGITSYTNPADNRVLTSVSSTTINSESNLTFDGTTLTVVAGDLKITAGSISVGGNIANSATDGRIDASNDIVAFSTSDRRLKENINNIQNPIEKILKLNGVEFDWIKEHLDVHGYEGNDVGVIAQDLKDVLPQALRINDSGYYAVRYEKIIPLLIECIKELNNEIKILKEK
jgi:hypothetical protein